MSEQGWSLKDLFYCQKKNFFLRVKRGKPRVGKITAFASPRQLADSVNKQLLDEVFVLSGIITAEVSVISKGRD